MKFNTNILEKLNEIYNNRENASWLEGVFGNFKQGRTILLVEAKKDRQFCLTDYDVVKNIADEIPLELIERLKETVLDYIKEQNDKLGQVQISNLPWEDTED